MERLTNKNFTKACNDPGDYCGLDRVCKRDCYKPEPCKIPKLLHRLAEIKDILGDDYDLDRLRELVEADREGRVRFVSKVSGDVCGTCKHFERFSGRKMGACRVKKFAQDRRGREDRSREFVASQSRRACKKYEPREE